MYCSLLEFSITDKEDALISEDEFMEQWVYNPLRDLRDYCPSKFVDENCRFKYLNNWEKSFSQDMFKVSSYWCKDKNDQIYDMSDILKTIDNYDKYYYHAISFIIKENKDDYTELELMKAISLQDKLRLIIKKTQ